MNIITNQLLNVDALAGLSLLPHEVIHLIPTSPPYNKIQKYGGHWSDSVWQAMIPELWRVLVPGGIVAWQVMGQIKDGNVSEIPEQQIALFRKCGFRRRPDLFPRGSRARLFPLHYYLTVAPVHIFTKRRPNTINLLTQPNNTAGQKSGGMKYRQDDGSFTRQPRVATRARGVRDVVWDCPTGFNKSTKDAYAFKHASIMPESLARDLILSYSRPGDLILDPMSGSGTTAKMALLNHRKYLGFEPWTERHLIAVRRLHEAQLTRQSSLRTFFGF